MKSLNFRAIRRLGTELGVLRNSRYRWNLGGRMNGEVYAWFACISQTRSQDLVPTYQVNSKNHVRRVNF